MNFTIRDFKPEDLHFILSTWLRNYKFSSYFGKSVKNDIFYKWHEAVIKRILERPGTQVLLAVSNDDPDLILGYLVWEHQPATIVIHYVYVKKAFRRFGIAKKLCEGFDKAEFTHMTFDYEWIKIKLTNLEYNPYRV